ncbi:MAG: cyclic nucleotide-binding domain-containing protein [Gemmataceae bacterium]|nr:cyclic nucleotide-binding domain-containing protein [Gemmataceae bacterium]
MQQLPADWQTIQEHLQGIPGLDAKALATLKSFYEEGEAKRGIHFFLIQYTAGEVIMAKGTTSDYAAVHIQGRVGVRDIAPPAAPVGRGCWEKPLARRLENAVLRQAATWPKDAPPGRGWFGWLAPLYRRLPGLPLKLIDAAEHWLPAAAAQRVRNHVARALHGRMPPVHRLERELSNPSSAFVAAAGQAAATPRAAITIRDAANNIKPLEDRFMGITGTLWNQPRSATLVADDDPDDGGKPCVMLLIKRKALEEIIKKSPRFYERELAEFVRSTLPSVLARNRLFRDRVFVEDVLDWPRLLAALRDPGAGWPARLGKRLVKALPWLLKEPAERLDFAEKTHIVEHLNGALTRRRLLAAADERATSALDDESRQALQRRDTLNDCEVFRLNRLLLEAAWPGVVASSPRPFPLTGEEFRGFTEAFAAAYHQKFGKPLQPDRLEQKDRKSDKKGVAVFKQGDPADCLFLLLSGMVRVSLDLPGGQSMVNNLEADAYFGESAVLEEGDAMPVRSAAVETLCSTTLLRLDRDVLRSLFAGPYQALGAKLQRERRLLSVRDEHMRAGRLLPPQEPPQALADKLMLTRNLLLIDMDKCTRCDQCVRGCAEAHDGQPRFHRANPKWRFGHWEVAGACLHCLDAPCQQVCPVGAITWLENQAVQIHRDRCIGCQQCARECPFDVIDMYQPTSPLDAPSSRPGIVANKCDLCLTDDYDPPCVACCPYDAAQRVDPVEYFPQLKSWANFAGRQ